MNSETLVHINLRVLGSLAVSQQKLFSFGYKALGK